MIICRFLQAEQSTIGTYSNKGNICRIENWRNNLRDKLFENSCRVTSTCFKTHELHRLRDHWFSKLLIINVFSNVLNFPFCKIHQSVSCLLPIINRSLKQSSLLWKLYYITVTQLVVQESPSCCFVVVLVVIT